MREVSHNQFQVWECLYKLHITQKFLITSITLNTHSNCCIVIYIPSGMSVVALQVHLGSPIGEGAFGTTYIGVWRGAEVAVKTVTVRGREDMVSFLREVEALVALRHPNIMPFLGACIQV